MEAIEHPERLHGFRVRAKNGPRVAVVTAANPDTLIVRSGSTGGSS
jgi:hypothetical protein